MTMVVGYPPGGAYDRYARLMAQHLPRHLPGGPSMIVQNMPGAGSLKAVQYLDLTAPTDGTTIVAFAPGLITQSVLEPENVKIDFRSVALIGSLSREASVCYTWYTLGLKSWEDVAKRTEDLKFGAVAKSSTSYRNNAVLTKLLGIKIRQVIGYPGDSEQQVAIEAGELDGTCNTLVSTPKAWIKDKKINFFVSFSETPAAGMPALPFAGDLAKTKDDKQIFHFIFSVGEIARPFAVSAKVPADRLALLRSAFEAMVKDPAFLAEADKANLPISHVPAAQAQSIVGKIYATPPELVAKAKVILE
jgi:tripartite-type tricarboxylate transporter receptor subunit TctC